MTDFYGQAGCSGITVLGIMGDAPELEAHEALDAATRMIWRTAGRPVIVGISSPDSAAMRTLALSVTDAGAAAIMQAA